MNRYLIAPKNKNDNYSDIRCSEYINHLQEYDDKGIKCTCVHFKLSGGIYGILLPQGGEFFDYEQVRSAIHRLCLSPLSVSEDTGRVKKVQREV